MYRIEYLLDFTLVPPRARTAHSGNSFWKIFHKDELGASGHSISYYEIIDHYEMLIIHMLL